MISYALRLIFLARFSCLVGLLLPGLVVLALWVKPELLGNLLVLDYPVQLFNVTWISCLVAALVLVTFRITQLNAPDRFGLSIPGGNAVPTGAWCVRWILWLLMGLIVPVFCARQSNLDPSDAWLQSDITTWAYGSVAILLGLIAALLVLFLLTALQQFLLHPNVLADHLLPFESLRIFQPLKAHRVDWLYIVGDKLSWFLNKLGPGYTRTIFDTTTKQDRRLLAPGHAQGFLWLGTVLVAYLGSYVYALKRGVPDEGTAFPVIFFALLVLMIFGALLTALSFLLDYYRAPVLVVLLLISMISYGIRGIDHFYDLNPEPQKNLPRSNLKLYDVMDVKDFPKVLPANREGITQPKRTLVIVTAAGGGIQASAWTAQVLTGLDEMYGPEFTRSIGLISAVSGGSVGAMNYLARGNWDAATPFSPQDREEVRSASAASCLEATGWGLAFPDLLRSVTPWLVSKDVDRGWAIEQVWGRHLPTREDGSSGNDLRLRDWEGPISRGKMPIIAFNSSVVESGKRMVISPVQVHHDDLDPTQPVEFFGLYPNDKANPRVTTAVRLSATFPYVSPISRPLRPDGSSGCKDYHLADGGYCDNEGMVTVLDWLTRLLAYYHEDKENEKKKRFDRILIIRIFPFASAAAPKAVTDQGWLYSTLGPITTIENVRTASQAERNSSALDMLSKAKEYQSTNPDELQIVRRRDIAHSRAQRLRQDINTIPADQMNDPAKHAERLQQVQEFQDEEQSIARSLAPKTEIMWTVFAYEGAAPPLSWKLTNRQKNNVAQAWDNIKAGNPPPINSLLKESPLQTLDRFFARVGK